MGRRGGGILIWRRFGRIDWGGEGRVARTYMLGSWFEEPILMDLMSFTMLCFGVAVTVLFLCANCAV